jgi:membrane protease subunit HflK
LVVAAIWLMTGFYQVDAPERAVIQRFGKYQSVQEPGWGWRLPWPIETVSKVNVSSVNSIDYQSRMLTADLNLVNISCAIQYQYADPLKVLFQVRDPEGTLREVSESAIREIIGQNPLNSVLAGEPRQRITANTRDLIQKTLDVYSAGIRVLSVNLTEVQVPEPVLPSQRDFNKAKEDRERFSQEARAYANDLLPRAQGTAQRQLLDAEAYKLQVVAAAEGDASRFTQLATAYAQAPDVTRNRMYIETMESVLSRSRKVLLDARSGGNNVFYLPLDKLTESAAQRNAVTVAPAVPADGTAVSPSDAATDPRSRERGER